MNSNISERYIYISFALTQNSNRTIGRTFGLSHNTIKRYRDIYLKSNLDLTKIEAMDDFEIASLRVINS